MKVFVKMIKNNFNLKSAKKVKKIKIKRRSISPLISTILLVVVAVVLVTIILNWGGNFSQESLGQVNKIRTYKKSDAQYYTYFDNSKSRHGSIYLTWNPPNYKEGDINLIGFRLIEDPEMPIYYLDDPYPMRIGQNLIPLGIVDDRFDLELYFDNNTMFIKEDLQMNFPANLSASDCPDGYVPVPGNTLYGTSSFCVMKYEAKVDTNGDGIGDTSLMSSDDQHCRGRWGATPNYYYSWCHGQYYNDDTYVSCPTDCNVANYDIVSSAEGYPIAHIRQDYAYEFDAKEACESIGEGYHLITNEEWMTIARNIERQPENWTGGQVGSGSLKIGNNNGSCTVSSACYNGEDPEYTTKTSQDETAKLVLSNGSSIWDLSGNMWEWVDKTLECQYHPVGLEGGEQSEWLEYSSGAIEGNKDILDSLGSLDLKDIYSLNNSYNTNEGLGRLYTDVGDVATSNRAVLRGGSWGNGSNAGPFAVYLNNYPSYRAIASASAVL
jgi:flagellin-like protein